MTMRIMRPKLVQFSLRGGGSVQNDLRISARTPPAVRLMTLIRACHLPPPPPQVPSGFGAAHCSRAHKGVRNLPGRLRELEPAREAQLRLTHFRRRTHVHKQVSTVSTYAFVLLC